MSENAQIDDDLFDRIHQAMLIRVTDKFPNVRIQAALAMTRLQQPKDPDCPTINGVFAHFSLFPSEFSSLFNSQYGTFELVHAYKSFCKLVFMIKCVTLSILLFFSLHVNSGKWYQRRGAARGSFLHRYVSSDTPQSTETHSWHQRQCPQASLSGSLKKKRVFSPEI